MNIFQHKELFEEQIIHALKKHDINDLFQTIIIDPTLMSSQFFGYSLTY